MKYQKFLNSHKNNGLSELELLRLLAFCYLLAETKSQTEMGAKIECNSFVAKMECYHRINHTAAKLLGKLEEPIPSQLLSYINRAVELWQKGTPLAYICGLESFADYIFAVGEGVLVPREDSEALLWPALQLLLSRWNERPKQIQQGQNKILELCCGTACISISLYLKNKNMIGLNHWEFWASDISAEALAYAEQNVAYYLGNDYSNKNFHLRLSNLFNQKQLQQKYELILANPPYLSMDECHRRSNWQEPVLALQAGEDGLLLLRRIIVEACNYLSPGGVLLLEAAPWQIYELKKILKTNGYRQWTVYHDTAGLERVISACISPLP